MNLTKSFFALAVGAAAAGVLPAAYGEAAESKVVGWAIVDPKADSANRQLLGVPFAGYDGGRMPLEQYLDVNQLATGDKLFVYDGTGYRGWSFNAGTKAWTQLLKLDRTTGAAAHAEGGGEYARTLAPGLAVWLERAAEAAPVALTGRQVENGPLPTDAGWNPRSVTTIEPGVADLDAAFPGATADDVVIVDRGTEAPDRLQKKDGVWGHYVETVKDDGKGHTIRRSVWKTDDVALAAGAGFWYVRKGAAE